MLRHARIYLSCIKFSWSKALEFRLDFWFRVIMDAVYYAMNVGFYLVLFSKTASIGGWTKEEAMVFVGAYLTVDAINMTLFSNNTFQIAQLINKGHMDYYLIKPVSSLFFLSIREFAAGSFLNLLMAIGLMFWAICQLPVPMGVGQSLLLCVLVLNGALLFLFGTLMFTIPSFYVQSGRGFTPTYYVFARFMERPDQIFRGTWRLFLMTVLPFSLMASVPVRIATGNGSWQLVGLLILVTAGQFWLVRTLWYRALRNYSSASS